MRIAIEKAIAWTLLVVITGIFVIGLVVCVDWLADKAHAQELTSIEHPTAPTEVHPAPPMLCGIGDLPCPEQERLAQIAECETQYADCAKWVADQENIVNRAAYKGCASPVAWVELPELRHFEDVSTCQANLGACGYTSLQAWMASSWVRANCK